MIQACEQCGANITKYVCSECSYVNKEIPHCGGCGSFRDEDYEYCLICRVPFDDSPDIILTGNVRTDYVPKNEHDALKRELEETKQQLNQKPSQLYINPDTTPKELESIAENLSKQKTGNNVITPPKHSWGARSLDADIEPVLTMERFGQMLKSGEEISMTISEIPELKKKTPMKDKGRLLTSRK